MQQTARGGPLSWTLTVPVVAAVVLVGTWAQHENSAVLVLIALCLFGVVFAAVHHAEVIAHRVGEPFGSLILAVAVTVIEVGMIVMLMTGGGPGASTYARDTVFAAVMITLNGIVGLSLLVGAARHRLVTFNASGSGAALATVITLAGVCLVLPGFTVSAQGLQYSQSQLIFAALASLILYGGFVFTQTVRHREFFVPVAADSDGRVTILLDTDGDVDADGEAGLPSVRGTWLSVAVLMVALICVVGLAKLLSPTIESAVSGLGLPHPVVGVVIALMVLAPETLAAVNNAKRNRVQISLNLAYGSAMASIGLTIPVIALAMVWIPGSLTLGLEPTQIVLLTLSVIVSVLTMAEGRALALQGLVHLVLLATFLFLSAKP